MDRPAGTTLRVTLLGDWIQLAMLLLLLVAANVCAQTPPEYVYRATRHMPSVETSDFNTLAEAEAWIRTEPATPIGNVYLEKAEVRNLGGGDVLISYKVRKRKFETYVGDFYRGHMSGNATDCTFLPYGCDTEQEMMEASLRAYPLSGSYTGTLRGAYLPMPPTMWGGNGRSVHVVKNAVQYSGAAIPNQREVVAVDSTGTSTYIYRVERSDYYECPTLFQAIDNTWGSNQSVKWPLICDNAAEGSIRKLAKQYAPTCPIPARDGNPCASDTGNKEYREKDFDWDGHTFARAYNSVAELPLLSGFGDSWAHSFSDRLMFDPWGAPLYWLRSDGYSEALTQAAADVYRSSNSTGTALYKELDAAVAAANGAWRIAKSDGTQLWFSESGRLRRSERNGRVLVFEYCKGDALGFEQCPDPDMLVKVTSSNGRNLDFEYVAIPMQVGAAPGQNTIQPRILRVKSGAGTLVEYTYDSQARLVRVGHGGAAGEGRQYLYAESMQVCRDGQGNNIASCNPANYPGHLTGVIDEGGVRDATYAYDEKGRVTRSEHAGGAGRVTLNYQSGSNVEVSLSSGARKTYEFNADAFKKPTKVSVGDGVNAPAHNTFATYSNDRITTLTAPNGTRTNFSYDSFHETTRVEGLTAAGATTPASRTIQTDWHTTLHLPTERRVYDAANALAARSTWTYNARGQVLTQTRTDPISGATHRTTTAYCEQTDIDAGICPLLGLLTSVDGPRTDVNDITTYTYRASDDPACATAPATCPYRKGDLWKVANALGQVAESLRYDGAGRVLSMKDANGVVTDQEYHPRGWLTARKVRGTDSGSEADDAITRLEYAPTGLVSKVIQPDGAFTAYTYDAAHRLTSIADNSGNRIVYTLDSAGNRTAEDTRGATGTLLRALSRVYNQLGQLQVVKDAYQQPTGFTYDANGNTDTATDALGRIIDNDYDPLNRLAKTIQNAGGINATTQFQYDALDQLTQVTDPKGLSTGYAYDGLGNLKTLTSPDTGVTNYTYDSAGNRKTQTDARGITATYSYDALNRLTGITYPTSALNVSYQYDTVNAACGAGETFAIGRLIKLTDGSGSTEYCYDRRGNLMRKVQTTNGKVFTLRYTYTLADRLASITYPSDARVDYVHNLLGQPSGVTWTPAGGAARVLLTSVTYYPFGPAAELEYGDGRRLRRTLNQNYQPGIVEDLGPGGLSLGYEFDPVGNLLKLRKGDQAEPPKRSYGYDGLDRLTSAKDGATGALLQGYAYDATGNRTGATVGTSTTPYTYPATSHRLSSVGSTDRSYDAVGNTTAIGSGGGAKGFVFDAANRLSQTRNGNKVAMNYAYNGRGEQVRRYPTTTSTAQTYAVYDEAGRVVGSYDHAGARLQEVLWLDDLPVGVIANGQLHYVEADHLGTPRVVIDPVREKAVWSWDLAGEAFGNSAPNQDPDADGTQVVFDLRFPGQRYDAASGLNYNYFRDYDATTGRYVQSDPIGLKGGVSTFAYTSNKPFLNQDPKGLFWFGPTCSAGQRAAIISEVIKLSNEIKEKADKAAQCPSGNCDWSLAAEVMRWIAHQAYFSCDRPGACAGIYPSPPYVTFYPQLIGAPDASEISSPGRCGCFRSAIFHEAAHVVRWGMEEDDVRRETLKCVSCGTNVSESGGPL